MPGLGEAVQTERDAPARPTCARWLEPGSNFPVGFLFNVAPVSVLKSNLNPSRPAEPPSLSPL